MRRRAFMAATAGALPAGFVVATQAAMADDASDNADNAKADVAAAGRSVVGDVAALTERLNPQVLEAREAALKVLKPSPRELERGLRLHAESVVFDTYGFSPRATIDAADLVRQIEAGASDIELKD